MPVKLVVAVTDRDWFEHLRSSPEIAEVNFWSPGTAVFRALEPGELFFFKLHAPDNFIAGFGVFVTPPRFLFRALWHGRLLAKRTEHAVLPRCELALPAIATRRQMSELIF
jgi:hypothetical protein